VDPVIVTDNTIINIAILLYCVYIAAIDISFTKKYKDEKSQNPKSTLSEVQTIPEMGRSDENSILKTHTNLVELS